jgi:hypothetical protein
MPHPLIPSIPYSDDLGVVEGPEGIKEVKPNCQVKSTALGVRLSFLEVGFAINYIKHPLA